jgi:hypothetical protein
MLRAVLSTLVSFIFGGVVIAAVQAVGHQLYPLPPGLDVNNPSALAASIAEAPAGALWMVELGYVLGSFAAGAAIRRLAPGRGARLPLIIGALFTLAGFMNLAAIPHPLWFAVLTTVTYIPMSLLGAKALGEGAGAARA